MALSAPVVIFADGLADLRYWRRWGAALADVHVPALEARSQFPTQMEFYPQALSPHPRFHLLPRYLVTPAGKPESVVVAYLALLDMAQCTGQIHLRRQRAMQVH